MFVSVAIVIEKYEYPWQRVTLNTFPTRRCNYNIKNIIVFLPELLFCSGRKPWWNNYMPKVIFGYLAFGIHNQTLAAPKYGFIK